MYNKIPGKQSGLLNKNQREQVLAMATLSQLGLV
jgi:hypothetical protein